MPGALRAALTAGRSPVFSRGMNEHETHSAKTPDLEAFRVRIRARLAEKAAERALHPPSPPPRYDETFFRVTAWLDCLSYTDDWSDCPVEPTPPDDEG